jgi:hypothetical protein
MMKKGLESVSILAFHVYLTFRELRYVGAFKVPCVAPFSRLPVQMNIGSKSSINNSRRNHIFEAETALMNRLDSTFDRNLHRVGSPTMLRSEFGTQMERSSLMSSPDAQTYCNDDLIQDLMDMARRMGPVGIRNSLEDQEKIQNLANLLRQRTLEENASSAQNFTDVTLDGVHELIYSAAPGGSSGKIGPLDGKVTQTFVNGTTFINAMDLGPLRIALTASRKIKDGTTISVRFHSTTVSLFGIPIITKSVGGGGMWNILYTGVVHDRNDKEHPKRLLRVLQTPSLFIIEQKSAPNSASDVSQSHRKV